MAVKVNLHIRYTHSKYQRNRSGSSTIELSVPQATAEIRSIVLIHSIVIPVSLLETLVTHSYAVLYYHLVDIARRPPEIWAEF